MNMSSAVDIADETHTPIKIICWWLYLTVPPPPILGSIPESKHWERCCIDTESSCVSLKLSGVEQGTENNFDAVGLVLFFIFCASKGVLGGPEAGGARGQGGSHIGPGLAQI